MSMPSFPDIPSITSDAAAAVVLASIGFENLGLAHIINAEGEKIQGAITRFGTNTDVTIEDLLNIDASVTDVLRHVIKKEIILEFELAELIRIFTL